MIIFLSSQEILYVNLHLDWYEHRLLIIVLNPDGKRDREGGKLSQLLDFTRAARYIHVETRTLKTNSIHSTVFVK